MLFSHSCFVPKHVATKGHRIHPRHIYPRFFYWIQLVFLLNVTGFFLQREAGVSICMRTPFVTPLVRHKINGIYRIFLSGVSDFWKSFLFVSATKNLLYPIFFIRYIRFVLIRGPTLGDLKKDHKETIAALNDSLESPPCVN